MYYKMHNTNIHPLGRNSFCYCPFSTLAAAVFHLKLVRGGVWGLVCQLVMWLSGMGDCLNPMPCMGTRWSDAEWPRQDDWKMLRFCIQNRQQPQRNPSPSTNIKGPFIFSQTGFPSLTQAAKVGEEWSRESPYQPEKWTFMSTIAPCFCHITLLYLITELPMNFSRDKGIKHLSS